MSGARIEKLNVLLSRVRERRAEARLMQIPGANALPSANTNLAPAAANEAPRPEPLRLEPAAARPAAPAEAPAPVPAESLEAALAARAQNGSSPAATPVPEVAERSEPPVQLKTPTSTVPPPSMPAEPMAAPADVVPPSPLRIAPSPALPFEAAVKVVSSPRIEAPKTFGDLLELSLALRPK